MLARARAALDDARYADAVRLADGGLAAGGPRELLLVRGDALRGLGRFEDAVASYRRAMRGAGRSRRAIAGLSAARLLATELGRFAEAREILDESGALAPGSPVEAAARRLDSRLAAR